MNTAVSRPLARAQACLARRDLCGAEQAIAPLIRAGLDSQAPVVAMLGLIRLNQARLSDAAGLLAKAHAIFPGDPMVALNLGRALAGLGRVAEAETAMRSALGLRRDWAEAHFELGQLLHHAGRLDEAETQFQTVLRLMPELAHAKLALGTVLTDQGRPAEAEELLRRALAETGDAALKAQINLQLATALLRQRKDSEALTAVDAADATSPSPRTALRRANALQNLGRHEEALAVFRALLSRAPGDPGLHHDYNALLHRLGRDDEFLQSYDRAPASRPLLLGKAHFLIQTGRLAEAHAIYAALAARDPGDMVASLGAARVLSRTGRAAEADAILATLLTRPGIASGAFVQAAETALLAGDPQKAAHLCEEGLTRAPANGAFLAILAIAWRMLEDEREEMLCGYDTFVRAFDLEPPPGFADMGEFNAQLDAALDRLHPNTREFLDQSLRGGTQTSDNLFAAGLPLVEKLKTRTDEAVARYIAEMPTDAGHPFLSRRTGGFRYAGSWSSRLRNGGFHINHVHPQGWISSCYYVALPAAVAQDRQGWIKFGEPQLDIALKRPIRRAIQPAPGRLVLFPSYLWHGTIPFQDAVARTTIAFDVAPARQ
jgi:tetratricopeptide (TPR) repeat protein